MATESYSANSTERSALSAPSFWGFWIQNAALPILVLALLVVSWQLPFSQNRMLTEAATRTYQLTQLEIVRAVARSVEQYLQEAVERHAVTDLSALEPEVLERFIAPVQVLPGAKLWLAAPDRVVFERGGDFPAEYRELSLAKIFERQSALGARGYEELLRAISYGREGVGSYVWLPQKGTEIAAWVPVRVGERVWVIVLSTPLREVLRSIGVGREINTSIVSMSLVTVLSLILLTAYARNAVLRRRAEEDLWRVRNELEWRVQERTAELDRLNEALRQDIVRREQAERSLRQREQYLLTLVELQKYLLHLGREDDLYAPALALLGQVSGASRVYIFENHRNGAGRLLMNQRAEWCAPGIHPELDNPRLQHLPYDQGYSRWEATLSQGEVIAGPVAEFPAEERPLLEEQGILSLMVIPLLVQGEFFGFIGFDHCQEAKAWNPSEVALLRSAAVSISLALERRRLEEQLLQAQKMEAIGRLAGGVAHDFNNLLTIINGFSQLLLQTAKPEDPWREGLEQIRQAGERGAHLTRQLLTFSRRQVLRPQVLNLNEVLEGLQKMLPRLLGEDIIIQYDLAQDLGWIKADPGQMEQVVLNLAVNARDAMPHGGTLTVRTANITLDGTQAPKRTGRYVRLTFQDTGVGMSAQVREHLFEPFFTTKEVGKGTGLGLSVVYGIVQQSGGWIEVESEPGRGSTFILMLPQVEAHPVATEAESPAAPRGSGAVLVVEDNENVRRLTVRLVRELGYSALEASNGPEALELLRRRDVPVDVVLSDVVMPQMNGRELAERARELRPEVRVLLMSGYPQRAGRPEAEAAFPILDKPLTLESLARALRQVLGNHPPPDASLP